MVNYLIFQETVGADRFCEVQGKPAYKSVTQLEISKEVSLPSGYIKGEELVISERKPHYFNAIRVACSSYTEGSHTHAHHTPIKDTIQT